KPNRKLGTLFLKFQPFFIERAPEAVDDHGYHDWPRLFNDERSPLSSGCEWLSSALWECDDPIFLQRSCYFPRIRWIQTTPNFFAFHPPGTCHRQCPGQREEAANKATLHGLFSCHVINTCKRI